MKQNFSFWGIVTVEVAAVVGVPEIKPEVVFTDKPAGKPVALKLVGQPLAVPPLLVALSVTLDAPARAEMHPRCMRSSVPIFWSKAASTTMRRLQPIVKVNPSDGLCYGGDRWYLYRRGQSYRRDRYPHTDFPISKQSPSSVACSTD